MKDNNLTNNSIKNSDARGKSPLVITVFVSLVALILVTFISIYFYFYTKNSADENNYLVSSKEYSKYYALICNDTDFNRQIFQYAKEKGDEMGICVDMLSQRMDHDYSIYELLEIAIGSNVDGIIVEAKDDQKMKGLIDSACQRGINVVTLLSDSPDSMRRSLIQVGAYNLGKKYGQQVVSKKLSGNETILVINDTSNSDASQNLIFTGIQDTVYGETGADTGIQIIPYYVDGGDKFEVEEVIRSVFIDEKSEPDIIICSDDLTTEVVYQALVDYNRVGRVRLIGYHDSRTILSGIEQGVIEATIAVDVKELGEYSIEALTEYEETGYASEYYSVDSTLIDIENIINYVRTDEEAN